MGALLRLRGRRRGPRADPPGVCGGAQAPASGGFGFGGAAPAPVQPQAAAYGGAPGFGGPPQGFGAAALQPAAKAAPKPSNSGSGPGPDAAQIKAAQSMSPDDRRKMIRSMVQRLAGQLKDNPDDAEGWLRLGRAHGVLGEHQKSRDAYAQAVKLRPRDINVLATYAQTLIQTATKGKIPPELAGMAKRILDIDPRNANGLWVAGLTAKEAGDMEAAGRHLRLLLTLLSPKAPERARVRAEIESLTKKE